MRLTGPHVANLALPAGKTETIIFDDALPGFGVRLRGGGKRVWIAQYRVGSKQRRVTIGNVEAVSADRARAAAKEILAKVQLGADPQVDKVASRKKAAVTLGVIADQYVKGPAKAKLRERSHLEVERHFRLHWKPLRETPIHSIDRADIAMRLNAIKVENGLFAANRARASLSSLFSWAMREGIVDANPVIGTNKATDEVSRDRVLSDDELALICAHCGCGDYGRIVKLLMLTGQRREEIGGMRWSELNLQKAIWSLPKERTKNGLPHDVPLSDAAATVIEGVTQVAGRNFVFGGGAGAFSGWSKSKAALDRRVKSALSEDARITKSEAKPMPPWRLHDLRRTAATRMHDLGVLPHIVESVLNHVSGHRTGVAGIYNRALYSTEKRAALDLWGHYVTGMMKGDE